MIEDLEIISLKILKVLYQYHLQKADSGLSEQELARKFDFLDEKKGIKLVQKALKEMRDQFLVRQIDSGVYMISEKGVKHYEQFKFIKNDEETSTLPSNVTINGNISEFQNRPNYHSHHYHLHGQNITFPGSIKEFMPHVQDLQKISEQIKELVMDSPNGKKVFEKLEEMEIILNLDSGIQEG